MNTRNIGTVVREEYVPYFHGGLNDSEERGDTKTDICRSMLFQPENRIEAEQCDGDISEIGYAPDRYVCLSDAVSSRLPIFAHAAQLMEVLTITLESPLNT